MLVSLCVCAGVAPKSGTGLVPGTAKHADIATKTGDKSVHSPEDGACSQP